MSSGHNPSSVKPEVISIVHPLPDISLPSPSEPKVSPSLTGEPAAAPSYALPTNLPSALRYLEDGQLGRLLAAVLAEQKQRGKKLAVSGEPSRKKRIEEVAAPLAQNKLNAVRAAFKAGVRPSRIAKQFGVSISDVRKALASDEKK